ncbi:hypothetical protein [Acidihalobacter prosperus]|uniref:Uncharacterized protein n=1 Tax=Acidihalobacter prosperus TaxID=160660 RepID=A0A1A6C8C9_9GAMM|nr:hypothetical protein [Acidihalobacter prosperus]OBS10811.1 hypothetical protein Thpro_020527 [Acidihalobacter prosperus]
MDWQQLIHRIETGDATSHDARQVERLLEQNRALSRLAKQAAGVIETNAEDFRVVFCDGDVWDSTKAQTEYSNDIALVGALRANAEEIR